MPNQINYWGNKLPKCPHCAADFQVWEGDNPHSLNYEDGGSTTFECTSCFKQFVCVTIVDYRFSTAISEEAASDEEWGPQETETENDANDFYARAANTFLGLRGDEQRVRMMTGTKITPQPEYDALNVFDVANSVEPFRTIAERIAVSHDFWTTHQIVDEISTALENAYNLGVKRGPLVPHPHT